MHCLWKVYRFIFLLTFVFGSISSLGCGTTIQESETSGIISSPNFPNSPSSPKIQCDWTINIADGSFIELKFLAFNITDTSDTDSCMKNVLKVKVDEESLNSYCNSNKPITIKRNKVSKIQIRFEYYKVENNIGFNATFRVISPTPTPKTTSLATSITPSTQSTKPTTTNQTKKILISTISTAKPATITTKASTENSSILKSNFMETSSFKIQTMALTTTLSSQTIHTTSTTLQQSSRTTLLKVSPTNRKPSLTKITLQPTKSMTITVQTISPTKQLTKIYSTSKLAENLTKESTDSKKTVIILVCVAIVTMAAVFIEFFLYKKKKGFTYKCTKSTRVKFRKKTKVGII